jgi:hypothetical protein
MRRSILAGAVLFLGLAAGTQAYAEPAAQPEQAAQSLQCTKWPMAVKLAQTNNPDASLVKVFDGVVAQQFVQIVNTLPPASNMNGNHVALFYNEDVQEFIALIGQGDCATYIVEVPSSVLAGMLGQEV